MVIEEAVSRGDRDLVFFNTTRGSKSSKTRPCVVVSSEELKAHLLTFVVAPLATGGPPCPFRGRCRFEDNDDHVVVDQRGSVDRDQLMTRLFVVSDDMQGEVLSLLQAVFAV